MPDENVSVDKKVVVNLGGEGEVPSTDDTLVINVNLPHVLKPGFVASRDGTTTLADIKQTGLVVIAEGDKLPFRTDSVDKIVANSVPIGDRRTWLGPAYKPAELHRMQRPPKRNIVSNG